VPPRVAWNELRQRAEELQTRFGLPFTRYVSRLRAMNRCTAEELLIAG